MSYNVSVYLMFAKIPLKSISFWQIWVEREHEPARYTVLCVPTRYEESATGCETQCSKSFFYPYYSFAEKFFKLFLYILIAHEKIIVIIKAKSVFILTNVSIIL